MKILVIGSNGQVGYELESALAHGLSVAGYDHKVVLYKREDLDLTEITKISTRLSHVAPDLIVNVAAYTAVDQAEIDVELAFTVNAHAATEIARYCQVAQCVLIHVSTDYVFDGKSSRCYDERDMAQATSVYGRSKLQGEIGVREVLAEHIILRTSWVFGAHGNNFVKTMLKLADSRDQLSVVSDQVGSPTASKSIAETIATIVVEIQNGSSLGARWGTYHYCRFEGDVGSDY